MSWIWPEINDREQARSAVRNAAITAWIIASLTGIASVAAITGHPFLVGKSALLDALLFAIVGWSLWRGSRVGAVCGLLLYSIEIYWMFSKGQFGVLVLVFIVAFIAGVRGSFKLHSLCKPDSGTALTTP